MSNQPPTHSMAGRRFRRCGRALRAALADFTGVPAANLMAGSGADELIDLLLRVLIEPGDRVLNLPPTFGMYPFDTHLNAGQVVEVPRREDFSLDMQRGEHHAV